VYILLLNSCINFTRKSARIAEISTEVVEVTFYVHPVGYGNNSLDRMV